MCTQTGAGSRGGGPVEQQNVHEKAPHANPGLAAGTLWLPLLDRAAHAEDVTSPGGQSSPQIACVSRGTPSRGPSRRRRLRKAKTDVSPSPGGYKRCMSLNLETQRVHFYGSPSESGRRVRVLTPAAVREVTPTKSWSSEPQCSRGSPHPTHPEGGPFFGCFGSRPDAEDDLTDFPEEGLASPVSERSTK